MTETKPLTANSTIGEWLTDPTGGPLIRGLLAQTGASEEMLAPIKGLPLQQLVALSQGELPQSIVDDLVLQANGGIAPVEHQETGWIEQVTPHRFTGQTVIITGAASGIGRATASRVAREGGTVIAVDISAERLESLKAALPQTDIVVVTGDITRQDDIDGIVATADPRQCGRTWRGRDRYPDATQHVAGRVGTACPIPATDPHHRHRRATCGIDHFPAVRRRHQHHRCRPPL
jgi:hypothetical protein